MAGDEEKTEDPTGKRLREAIKKGNSPKSREVSTAALLLVCALFFRYYMPYFVTGLGRILRDFLSIHHYELTVPGLTHLMFTSIIQTAIVAGPFFAVIFIAAYAVNVAQVGFLFTPGALKLNLGAINPFTGWSKFFSKRSLVELLKSLVKIFLISYIAYLIVRSKLDKILVLADMELLDIFTFLGEVAYEITWKISLIFLIFAYIDLKYQQHQHKQDLKMTKQEVKEEHKQMEGDPKVKGRIRQVQREMARRRMMDEVPKADVVITNPTHYAVALQYSPGVSRAPVCVAKGERLMALRIREVAKEHGILIHEDPPIARSLFKTVDIGDEIPENLYKAVAEILSMVQKFRK